ncbi:MAG: MotA/TolQ/ExbB proton channel family protein [Cytophagales bacterium]|nr:MotA/TolQ/ExbB proton channel family protein [Cytophaga sp.]
MLLSLFAQIQPVATAVADTATVAATAATAEDISLLDMLFKGGYLMIPILLLSVAAVAIFFERYFYIKHVSKMDNDILETVKKKLSQGKLEEAKEICEASRSSVAKLYGKALNRIGSPVRDIESIMENMASLEVNRMEKNLGFLGAIAAVAPMVGFLGTVVGMIKSFYNISIANDISIGIIAGGIYEKMITSASGLIVGVLAYILYTFLTHKIDHVVLTMEENIIDFLDVLYKPSDL